MLINFTFIRLILLTYISCSHLNNDDNASSSSSSQQRQKLVRKHFKRLKKVEGAIKLVDGRNHNEGNVEILHNGKWGNICDDEWDKLEADVVCRQLNYPLGGKATHSGKFGIARRRYWMDNLFCTGREEEISQCRFDGWGQSDCDDTEAAGVICNVEKSEDEEAQEKLAKIKEKPSKYLYKSHDEMTFHLVGGRLPSEGRVEVKFGNGPYGEICGDGWSLLEANVICKELNLGYANEAFQTDFFGSSNGTNILLSGTECVGNETKLSECKFESFKQAAKCRGKKNHVAGVSCVKQMADLVLDTTELEITTHLEDRPMFFLTCAMEENCLASQAYEIQKSNTNWHLETRRLLKFTAKVLNNGTADFRPNIPKNLWEFHLCHMYVPNTHLSYSFYLSSKTSTIYENFSIS
jgi:lysyl oxidase-like protein 2/3/4